MAINLADETLKALGAPYGNRVVTEPPSIFKRGDRVNILIGPAKGYPGIILSDTNGAYERSSFAHPSESIAVAVQDLDGPRITIEQLEQKLQGDLRNIECRWFPPDTGLQKI